MNKYDQKALAKAAIREALAEPVKQEPVAFNIAAQCRATASDAIAANIIVDAGSGTLRELLLDAAQALENAAPVDAKAIRALKLVYDNSTSHDWPEDIWNAIVDALYEEHRKTMATAPQLLGG